MQLNEEERRIPLPLEIYVCIGSISRGTWAKMISVRPFAEWSMSPAGKKARREMFTFLRSDKFALPLIDGILHCIDDEPAIWTSPKYLYCGWFSRGELHREDDEPALCIYHLPVAAAAKKSIIDDARKGKIRSRALLKQFWFRRGLLHREDKPAVWEKKGGDYSAHFLQGRMIKPPLQLPRVYPSSEEQAFEWMQTAFERAEYCDEGASRNRKFLMYIDGTGKASSLHFCEDTGGRIIHRDDGPVFHEKNLELWMRGGVIHRDNGPAVIYRGYRYYYIDGVHMRGDQYQRMREIDNALHGIKWRTKNGKLRISPIPLVLPKIYAQASRDKALKRKISVLMIARGAEETIECSYIAKKVERFPGKIGAVLFLQKKIVKHKSGTESCDGGDDDDDDDGVSSSDSE